MYQLQYIFYQKVLCLKILTRLLLNKHTKQKNYKKTHHYNTNMSRIYKNNIDRINTIVIKSMI